MKRYIGKIATSIILSTSLAMALPFNSQVKAEESNNEYVSMEDYIMDAVIDGYNNRYNVREYDYYVQNSEISEGKVVEYAFVTLYATQIEESIDDAPYIQGMRDGIDLIKDESTNSARDLYLEGEFYGIKSQMDDYIGIENELCLFLKIEADMVSNEIDQDSITIYTENIDEYIPLENILPKDANILYQEGIVWANHILENYLNNVPRRFGVNRGAEQNYRMLMQYMTTYTSNPTGCDTHSNCGMLQDTSKWNNATYAYDDIFEHNDCADYVSQALYAAGITEDSKWNAVQGGSSRSEAWRRVSKLTEHMEEIGVFTQIQKADATAGDIIVTNNGGHIVVITAHSSAGYKFSGHTKDRLQSNITLDSSWTYYRVNF